jgi:hypothetical protein
MENGHILDGVDDDVGEKFIWQYQHTAATIKENGGNSTVTGFEFEWR